MLGVGGLGDLDAAVGPLHQSGRMIEHLAGIRNELADDLGVHATGGALNELGGRFAHVVGAIPLVDQPLGVDVSDVLALDPAVLLGDQIDHHYLGAPFGSSQSGLDARMARTRHQHVAIYGRSRLHVGGRPQPTAVGSAIALEDRGRSLLFGARTGHLRRAVPQSRRAGRAHCGDASELEEVAARDSLVHLSSF